jgi:hypothetical protein
MVRSILAAFSKIIQRGFCRHKIDKTIYIYIYIYIHTHTYAGPSDRAVYGRSPAAIVGLNPIGDMDVCCVCCVLSGRGLCDELIIRPEESY